MFSLCIPTMNRYDTFLKTNLEKYVDNPYIGEIIITDENGKDYDNVLRDFKTHIDANKIKIYKNESVLGPFLNKSKAMKLSSNEWIALIDSDNFADINYFRAASEYISTQSLKKESLLVPSYATADFDFTHLEGQIINKRTISDISHKHHIDTLMNLGNFVINRYLIEKLNLVSEIRHLQYSPTCDVIYFMTLLFEQFDLDIHVPKGLHYTHVVHSGSVYLTSSHPVYYHFAVNVHKRFDMIKQCSLN